MIIIIIKSLYLNVSIRNNIEQITTSRFVKNGPEIIASGKK